MVRLYLDKYYLFTWQWWAQDCSYRKYFSPLFSSLTQQHALDSGVTDTAQCQQKIECIHKCASSRPSLCLVWICKIIKVWSWNCYTAKFNWYCKFFFWLKVSNLGTYDNIKTKFHFPLIFLIKSIKKTLTSVRTVLLVWLFKGTI